MASERAARRGPIECQSISTARQCAWHGPNAARPAGRESGIFDSSTIAAPHNNRPGISRGRQTPIMTTGMSCPRSIATALALLAAASVLTAAASLQPPLGLDALIPGRTCSSCHMPAVAPQNNLRFTNHWIGTYDANRALRPREPGE